MITVSLGSDAVFILTALAALAYAALVGYWNARPEYDDIARDLDWLLVAGGVSLIAVDMLFKHGLEMFVSHVASIVKFGLPMIVAVIAARRVRRRRERIEAQAREIEGAH